MFGVQVPRKEKEARELDVKYDNLKLPKRWDIAECQEIDSLKEYKTFKRHTSRHENPPGHRRIKVFFVYAVKHDLHHKARLVAGGHMTPDVGVL